ncbi:MAG: MBL fold metallo-hydrolase, partial [Thermoleophilaceae bacterium]
VHERLERVRRAIAGEPRTPYDLVPEMLDHELPEPMMIGWGLSEALCYLRHLELRGGVEKTEDAEPERWSLAR